MRIAGHEGGIRAKATVELPRPDGPIRLTVYALPPDYPEQAERELPSPSPKRKGFHTIGKRLAKDGRGRPIPLYDEEDPAYKAELNRMQMLQSVKMIHAALDPSEVTFETSPNGQNPVEFYQAIRAEMAAFGFSVGDLSHLVEGVADVSNIDRGDLAAATSDFFATEGSPSDT